MKKVLVFLSLAVGAFAQTSPQVAPNVLPSTIQQKGVAATYSDVYCSGWMSPKDIANSSFVLAGEHSPNAARFVTNESVFLSGSGWQEGQKVSIVRRAKDPNYFTMYEGQNAEVKKAGLLFFDMGQATVTFVQGNTAVAHIDFSCDPIVPGDLVIPFEERAIPSFHPRPFNFQHFVALKNSPTGRIVLSKDFDAYLGEGKKFYVNIGSNQGLKVGDYLRIWRGYTGADFDPTDKASLYSLNYDDDQYKEPSTNPRRFGEAPKRSLAEAVVLMTTPTTATAMITFATEDVHIGDHFKKEPQAAESAGN